MVPGARELVQKQPGLDSELSGLFVTDLGNQAGESVLVQTGDTPVQIAKLALFSNVQAAPYWAGTVYAPGPGDAWHFDTADGSQRIEGKNNTFFALAVRPGDAAAVPQPQTYLLLLLLLVLGLGLGVVPGVAQRRA